MASTPNGKRASSGGSPESLQAKKKKLLPELKCLNVSEEDTDKTGDDDLHSVVHLSRYDPPELLRAALNPVDCMKGVWQEIEGPLTELLQDKLPLKFGAEEKAWCAPFSKVNCGHALTQKGRYLCAVVFNWTSHDEMDTEFATWPNIKTCENLFFSKPNDEQPHLIGSVEEEFMRGNTVPPSKSIKLKGCYELVSGLGLSLRKAHRAGTLADWEAVFDCFP